MHILNLLEQGPLDYLAVDTLQRYLNQEVAQLRHPDTLIIWEAKDVYTAGRRTQPQDVPNSEIPVIAMDRGGSVTYHGPGQLVIYPIVKVKPPSDVVRFVRETELAVINAMQKLQVTATQIAGRSGAWIQQPHTEDRKLCAIGIKFREDTTMHGLALNVHTDLEKFKNIIPCGITDAGVTSLAQLGINTSLTTVAELLSSSLTTHYNPLLIPERAKNSLVFLDPQPYQQHLQIPTKGAQSYYEYQKERK